MGTASEDMARSTRLLLVLATFTFLPLLSAQQTCCKKKIVSGKVAVDAGLDGTYTLIEGKTTQESACVDGCVYKRDSGNTGDEYCFKAVDPGADIQDKECAAVTGTTAGGPQSTLSSDQLRKQAPEAADRITENNKKIEEGNKNIENAEDATAKINEISNGLKGARKNSREKRQDSSTVKPVDKPENCDAFKTIWFDLLTMAVGGVSDDNINQIKAYIDALKDVDVKSLCVKTERDAIVADEKNKVDEATAATEKYTGDEKAEVTELKKEVNKDIAILEDTNQKLKDRDEAPVSTPAVSTYKIDPTIPAGGETTKPSSDGETSPAGGMTSKPPIDGQTSPSAGMTSKPDGGETSKPPTGGESSPAGGQTSQSPPGGESTPSKPGAVSTAKPQRNLFERKRSRGSIM